MEGKDSICKILRSITEVEMAMDRDLLLDYVMGRPTQIISQKGLDNTEQYGCGDEKDEEHWTVVVEKCIEEGFLKIHTDGIKVTAKGKKYLKKPTSIELSDAEEEEVTIEENVPLVEDEDEVIKEKKIPKATNSQRKRALIQAVDRHVALDDFATNHGLDFDEVMDDMEGIIASGMKLDLKYFGYEVLGKEAMDELFEYFDSAETDNMEKAIDEYGDVYNREELRLGRILWRAEKL
ncbi:MAG: hypothetical protein MJZ60_07320 [Bacteroidaceae bacterium]|nr:hypothetical protein [Bacteroidaceae bacterium]